MKLFPIGDVLSVTTGRLVSETRMEGLFSIMNFLTADNLSVHQLPRALREAQPWIRTQYPQLMEDSQEMAKKIEELDYMIDREGNTNNQVVRASTIATWLESVRTQFSLPESLPVYAMGEGMHADIDPVEELMDIVGSDRVLIVDAD